MKIVRTFDPSIIDELEDWILGDDGQLDREIYLQLLRQGIQDKENFFFVLGFDGGEVKAMMIASAPPNANTAWLYEAHIEPGYTKLGKQLWSRISSWASDLGRVSIRSQTKRNTEALLRSWSFKTIATVVERPVDQNEVLRFNPNNEVFTRSTKQWQEADLRPSQH